MFESLKVLLIHLLMLFILNNALSFLRDFNGVNVFSLTVDQIGQGASSKAKSLFLR